MTKWIAAIVLALGLTACAGVEVQSPKEGVAACYFTVRTAFATAADVKARGALPADQEKLVVSLGDQALAACDAALVAIGAGDFSTADSQLKIANAVLLQLEAWLKAQGAK